MNFLDLTKLLGGAPSQPAQTPAQMDESFRRQIGLAPPVPPPIAPAPTGPPPAAVAPPQPATDPFRSAVLEGSPQPPRQPLDLQAALFPGGMPSRPPPLDVRAALFPPQAPATGGKPQKLSNDQRMERAINMQEEGLANRAAIVQEEAKASALGNLQAVEEYKQRQEADMQFRAKQDADIARRRAGIETEVNKLANQRVDPSHVFKNTSTPALIAGAAIAFLSGWQSAKTGQNPALAMIQKIINDDIQSQMTGIETKRSAIGAKQTLLQQDIAAGADAYDSRLKASALAFDTAIKSVAAEAAAIGTPKAFEDARILMGQLEQQKAMTFEQWQDQRKQRALQGAALAETKRQHDREWVQGELNRFERIGDKAMAASALGGKAAKEERALTVAGTLDPTTKHEWVATDPESKKEATRAVFGLSLVNHFVERRNALRAQYDSETWPTEGKDRMAALDQGFALAIKAAEETGAMDKGSMEFIDGYLGKTDRFTNISAQSDEILRNSRAKAQAKLMSLGFRGEVTPMKLFLNEETDKDGKPSVSGTRSLIDDPPVPDMLSPYVESMSPRMRR